MVSLSVFAGPARILRRFSVFAEEPRKSIITATEPCNQVFKEAQPRPSNHKPVTINNQSVIQFSHLHSSLMLCFWKKTVVIIKYPAGLC